MAKAITNQIKTYYTLYAGKEESGALPMSVNMRPMRFSECSLEGSTEEITSDVIIPETRIPSTPERGSESCSGDLNTEFNLDEQDDFFEGVFCNDWTVEENQPGETSHKKLVLGDVRHSYGLLKKFPQTPVLYQYYKNVYINSVTMDFATDDFVKLTWGLMGANNPIKETDDPLTELTPVYSPALNTKSFITINGFLKLGNSVIGLNPMRQSPSMSITIDNNMERTPALCEKESIENSLGDFTVTGTLDSYDVDDLGKELYNSAVNGEDKVIQIAVERTIGSTSTSYILTLPVHLSAPAESKNGNKLQFSVPFTVNKATNLMLEKIVKEIV